MSTRKRPASPYGFKVLHSTPIVLETVYGLVDPDEPDRVRYVGRTLNPFLRYLQHCLRPSSRKLGSWVKELRDAGRWPVMVRLAECSGPPAVRHGVVSETEASWIAHLLLVGGADLNTHCKPFTPFPATVPSLPPSDAS